MDSIDLLLWNTCQWLSGVEKAQKMIVTQSACFCHERAIPKENGTNSRKTKREAQVKFNRLHSFITMDYLPMADGLSKSSKNDRHPIRKLLSRQGA
jgi:hypothetical protein